MEVTFTFLNDNLLQLAAAYKSDPESMSHNAYFNRTCMEVVSSICMYIEGKEITDTEKRQIAWKLSLKSFKADGEYYITTLLNNTLDSDFLKFLVNKKYLRTSLFKKLKMKPNFALLKSNFVKYPEEFVCDLPHFEKIVEDAINIAAERSGEDIITDKNITEKYLNKWYYKEGYEDGCDAFFVTNLIEEDYEIKYTGIHVKYTTTNSDDGDGIIIYNNTYAPSSFCEDAQYIEENNCETIESITELLDDMSKKFSSTEDLYTDILNYVYRCYAEFSDNLIGIKFEKEMKKRGVNVNEEYYKERQI